MSKKILISFGLVIIALIAILSLVLLSMNSIPSSPKGEEQFFVSKVIDGDTFELNNGHKVRLAGINAPEKNAPYAQQATAELKKFAEEKNIFLQYNEFDQYGRILGYIFLEKDSAETVNEKMLELGLAHSYTPSLEFAEAFEAAEKKAMEANTGIWHYSQKNYVEDECLSLAEFNFNAAGNDNENLLDEFFVLKNSCDYEIDLDGWTVKDEATNSFTFPQFILLPTWEVTLRTGKGSDNSTDLYWNSSSAIWNNDGDKLFLRNFEGELVLYYEYP